MALFFILNKTKQNNSMKKLFQITFRLGSEKKLRKIYTLAVNYGDAEEKAFQNLREEGFILKNSALDFQKIEFLGKVIE